MRQVICSWIALLLLVTVESGCNEALGIDEPCYSCGGAKDACTEDKACPERDELCEDQLLSWDALTDCLCESAHCPECGQLCGNDVGDDNECAACIITKIPMSCNQQAVLCKR